MLAKDPVRATITKKGRCREDGYSEPYALLEDGRTMPMGWNRSGPIFEVGTTGIAQYVSTSTAGLWRFTPDRNGVRAARGIAAIKAHPDYTADDVTTAAADTIADILHGAGAMGVYGGRAVDAQDLLDLALTTYEGDAEDES